MSQILFKKIMTIFINFIVHEFMHVAYIIAKPPLCNILKTMKLIKNKKIKLQRWVWNQFELDLGITLFLHILSNYKYN